MNIDFHRPTQRGRKAELFLVLDCETATLPFVANLNLTPKQKQKVAIAKPLIYDIGWQVIDRKGRIYSQHSFLIQETFFVPQVFNTAYYREKRPIYMDRFSKGEIVAITWEQAMAILESDLSYCSTCFAYNSMFDFKKAIPFTEEYIAHLYSADYQKWEDKQRKVVDNILDEVKWENPNEFDGLHFNFRDNDYDMCDLWGLSCNKLINEDEYKINCLEKSLITQSGLFFKTSAETTFQYLANNYDFEEEHTALGDVLIESQILLKILKKGTFEKGIQYFPFNELGKTVDFITNSKNINKITVEDIQNVIDIMYMKLNDYDRANSFASQLETEILRLERYSQKNYHKIPSEEYYDCRKSLIEKQIKRKEKYLEKLNLNGSSYNRVVNEIKTLRVEIENLKKELGFEP